MCGQHNVRVSAVDNTGQNTGKGHIPNSRTEIKIPDLAGNRTRAAVLEGRVSTNHATATDLFNFKVLNKSFKHSIMVSYTAFYANSIMDF